MKIGIIVAMSKELKLLLDMISDRKEVTVNGFTFHSGTIEGREVVASQCGIGKVNAAIGTLSLIETFHPSLVINTGVAGGAGAGTHPLDIVVGERVAYHDTYCGPDTEWGEMSGCPRYFEAPAELVEAAVAIDPRTKAGLICSGDFFVSTPEEVAKIKSTHPDVTAVDMESAAIAHVCERKNVPFIAIRVISDTPGEADNIAQYENFWEDAPASTFNILSKLLPKL